MKKPFDLVKAVFMDIVTLGGLFTFRYYTYTGKLLREWLD